MSDYERMDAFEFRNVLNALSSDIQKITQKHNQNLDKIDDEFHSLQEKIKIDTESLDDRTSMLTSEIKALQEKIFKLLKREYAALAESELKSYIESSWQTGIIQPNPRELDEAQLKLKSLYSKKRFADGPERTNLIDKRTQVKADYVEKKSQEERRFKKEKSTLVDKIKKEYYDRQKFCVKPYTPQSVPNDVNTLPNAVVLGNLVFPRPETLKSIFLEETMSLPMSLNLWNEERTIPGDIIINISTEDLFGQWKDSLENIVVGLLLKWLDEIPCDMFRIGIFSSVLSSLEKLNAFSQATQKGNIMLSEPVSNQADLAHLLSKIKSRGEEINQKIYNNSVENLYALYKKNVKEPMNLIVLQDAIRDMTDENLRVLYDCLRGYRRCGFRFIIVDNFDEGTYTNKSNIFKGILSQLRESCQNFYFSEGKISDENGNLIRLVELNNDVDRNAVYDFCVKYCRNIDKKEKESVSYERIGFGKDTEKIGDWNVISIPVGLDEPNVWRIDLSCQETPPIANLIVGAPGTGKSTLIDAMILNGAIKYSPDELNFHLLDFKDSISSSVYTRSECQIPHVKVVSRENKEDAGIILSNILRESERRNEEFKILSEESGVQIRNIADYNIQVASGKFDRRNMPRLVIVIDECQCVFDDEVLAKQCETIVRKCRAQGIHLILATQSTSRKMWNTIKFVDGRYCFEIATEDAGVLLNYKYVSLIKTDVPKGSYMAFASNDYGQTVRKIKAAFYGKNLDNSDHVPEYAKKIREKWSNYPIDMFIVGDKSPCLISQNAYIDKLKQLKLANEIIVPLGVNYGDASLITLRLRDERMNSMLLVGSDTRITNNICYSILLSTSQQGAKVYAVDASKQQSLKMACEDLNDARVHVYTAAEYAAALQDIWSIYNDRSQDMSKTYDPVFFIVDGVQRINNILQNSKLVTCKEVRQKVESRSMEDFDDINEFFKYTQQQSLDIFREGIKSEDQILYGRDSLMELYANGYKVNVYLCLTMDSVDIQGVNGEPVFGYSQKRLLANSDYKILFNDVKDCSSIMDTSFRGLGQYKLNEHMAFMADGANGYYKFRIYEHEI